MAKEENHASGILAQAFWQIAACSLCMVSLCLAFGLAGCEHSSLEASDDTNGHGSVQKDTPVEVKHKLKELNKWEHEYGNRSDRRANYDVPGEAQAYMDQLKKDLAEMGFAAQWDTARGEYRLVRKDTDRKE